MNYNEKIKRNFYGNRREIKLCDIGEIVGGATPSTKNQNYYNNGSISWITPKDLSNYNNRFISKGERNITEEGMKSCSTRLLPKNSILFTSRAPIGYIAIASNELCTNQGFKSIISNEKFYYMYVYYLLKQNKNLIESIGSGTTFKEVSGTLMKNVKVKVTTNMEEQKAIAKTLSCLDEKIELNNKINKNLEEMAQAIFKKWFIDFDYPLTEEEINNGGREFVDSEMGKIPKGWKVGKLGESYITSMLKSGINNFIGKKVYLATADVENTNIINRNTKITLNEKPSRANMQPKSKTVWFAKMKDSRKLIVIDDYSEDLINNYIFSTGFAGIECFNNSLYYIWAYLLTNEFDITKNNLCNGTTMQAINNENINKINILIPTIEVLKSFEDISLPIFKKWYINNKENEKLTQIRDTLLPKLINGDIRVPY